MTMGGGRRVETFGFWYKYSTARIAERRLAMSRADSRAMKRQKQGETSDLFDTRSDFARF
jgi:hypothetical protein